MITLLTGYPLCADHAQFLVFDESTDPYDPEPEITEEFARRGWTRTKNVVVYFTVGQLWTHRLDIFLSDVVPDMGHADRLLRHNLSIPSGTLKVGNPIVDDIPIVNVESGDYSLYLRAYNMGVESETDDETEVVENLNLERYELILFPGFLGADSLVSGAESLW